MRCGCPKPSGTDPSRQPHKEALLLPGGDPGRGFSPAGLPTPTKQLGGTPLSPSPRDPARGSEVAAKVCRGRRTAV